MQPGLNLLIPIVDRVRVYHDLRIQQTNVPPQKVITKDNVQVEIDTIIFYQVVEPELATYGISNYEYGVRNITSATMRQIIGKMELDETLSGREKISTEIRLALMKLQKNGAFALNVLKLSILIRRKMCKHQWKNK